MHFSQFFSLENTQNISAYTNIYIAFWYYFNNFLCVFTENEGHFLCCSVKSLNRVGDKNKIQRNNALHTYILEVCYDKIGGYEGIKKFRIIGW